jgi:hypothetical protein
VIRGHGLLGILVAPTQPTDVLTHATRALALLATRKLEFRFCIGILLLMSSLDPSLFRHLLSFPYGEDGQEQVVAQDISQLPHIQTLCYYLVDPARDSDEVS